MMAFCASTLLLGAVPPLPCTRGAVCTKYLVAVRVLTALVSVLRPALASAKNMPVAQPERGGLISTESDPDGRGGYRKKTVIVN